MSTDRTVTKDLIETLEDGREGFTKAADRLADDRPEISTMFREFAEQRAEFSTELRTMAHTYGDDIDESGSIAATMHRGWMALKDALSGNDSAGVIDVAQEGEDHAVSEYREALDSDISPRLRTVLERQFHAVEVARDRVKGLAVRT